MGANLGVAVLLDAGPIELCDTGSWGDLFFVTESCMASGDVGSLASPGTLPGHSGSQNVKKLQRDQDGSGSHSHTHFSAETSSSKPLRGRQCDGSQLPAHTHFL